MPARVERLWQTTTRSRNFVTLSRRLSARENRHRIGAAAPAEGPPVAQDRRRWLPVVMLEVGLCPLAIFLMGGGPTENVSDGATPVPEAPSVGADPDDPVPATESVARPTRDGCQPLSAATLAWPRCHWRHAGRRRVPGPGTSAADVAGSLRPRELGLPRPDARPVAPGAGALNEAAVVLDVATRLEARPYPVSLPKSHSSRTSARPFSYRRTPIGTRFQTRCYSPSSTINTPFRYPNGRARTETTSSRSDAT